MAPKKPKTLTKKQMEALRIRHQEAKLRVEIAKLELDVMKIMSGNTKIEIQISEKNAKKLEADLKRITAPKDPKRLFACEICDENYSAKKSLKPMMLKCGHTFCNGCIDKIVETRNEYYLLPVCPLCNQEFDSKLLNKDVLAYNKKHASKK